MTKNDINYLKPTELDANTGFALYWERIQEIPAFDRPGIYSAFQQWAILVEAYCAFAKSHGDEHA